MTVARSFATFAPLPVIGAPIVWVEAIDPELGCGITTRPLDGRFAPCVPIAPGPESLAASRRAGYISSDLASTVTVVTRRDDAKDDAATMLRRLLEAIEHGELEAPGSQGARLLRRMEGAIAALDIATGAAQ